MKEVNESKPKDQQEFKYLGELQENEILQKKIFKLHSYYNNNKIS